MKMPSLLKYFAALSLRERILTVIALVGVLFFIVEAAWVRPQRVQAKALQDQIARQVIERNAFTETMKTLASRPKTDPLAQQRAERDQLRVSATEAEAIVQQATANVRMGDVIRTLAARTPGVTLVGLKTFPGEMFFKGLDAAPGRTAMPALYKHSVEVAVQGQYAALVRYMQALERTSPGTYWGPMKLEANKYPDSTLKFTLYTVSVTPELSLN